ncbi:hypothetical protein TBLA_0B08410 [Henningerozyma blattae CBS 6284]|uniref:Enoyl reductase (ER) domain-containing protein n=1 Tax=Henningerozyma blattae (strain ATCC 34711 / CBS 6284 / DSM 70876 / NBRC 10599 / NRRL Y-10934 / UCD 77-7) TaxID=1071380 RepID=I2GZV4_HENB6|nr:hypothetical protein TBLA_0B08410 [Tetrapisispora blattae CBS 6284]CCH59656.1 hypothetical protein TBLA_0B08410 [Tetrapisispora blattae CBS 6284]
MSSTIPTTMKAVVIEGNKPLFKENIPVPKLPKGFMLIKVKAVAGNPTDWKHCEFQLGPQGSVVGCDASGEVVQLGPDVDPREFKVGDHVFSFVHGSSNFCPENGAFGEYVAVDTASTFKASKPLVHATSSTIPSGTVSTWEDTASVPLSFTTAGASLFHHFKLKMEWEPAQPQRDFPVLVWGGATALGQPLIQLMKQINAYSKIIVVASKKHEKKLKAFGADEVFDYHDTDVIEQITSKYNNIQHLYDTVSIPETTHQVYKCAAKNSSARVLQYMFMTTKDIDEKIRRDDVSVAGTLIYCVGEHDVELGGLVFKHDPTYRKIVSQFIKFVQPRLYEGKIKHVDITIYKGGLQEVPRLLKDIQTGKNSGSKLVATL